ncbi:MAG: pilus assembly protein PilM [Candidatus Omnitrophota bacterium]
MMNMGQKSVFLGIDIGSSYIKAVELDLSGAGEPVVRKANIVPKSEGLGKALAGMQTKGARAVGIVDCPTSCLRYFTIPSMPDRELGEAIKWEAKDKVSYPLDEAVIAYETEEEAGEGGLKKLRVKFVASPKKFVDAMMAIMAEAGIDPVAITEPPLAIENIAKHMGFEGDAAAAVIDIGAESTGINIVKKGSLKFHRKIGSGGVAITKAITSVLITEHGRVELGYEEAEGLKIKYGIPPLPGTDLLDGKINSQQLISLIRPATERLVQEIERSFEYYSDGSLGDKVKSVVLVGGGASMKGMAQFLQETLDIPVSVGDAFKGMRLANNAVTPGAEPHRFAAAVGAALSEGKGINLLPSEKRHKTARTFGKAAMESVVAAVVLMLAFSFISMHLRLSSLEKRIKYGEKELEAMRPQIQIALNYERLKRDIAKKKDFINKMLSEEPPLKEVLKELSNKIPKEAVLTGIRINDKDLIIRGEILGEVTNREEALSVIIAALQGGLFRETTLVNARMSEDTKAKAEFEIKCEF